jgi:hypothetical protein
MAAVDQKLSTFIADQVPDFVKEEGPKFEAFIRAYYEFLEREGNPHVESKTLLEYQDLDTTIDKYLEFLKREIFHTLPDNITADKKHAAKLITELYRSKGSKKSYQFLFRILFDEEIDIYFPGDFILRASYGNWVQETSIRVIALSGSHTLAYGKVITGQTSGARGRVHRIELKTEFGVKIAQMFLKDILGTFEDDETVITEDSALSGKLFNDTGVLNAVSIQFAGRAHRVGDLVDFTATTGVNANGFVSAVDDASAVTFLITEGGQGYRTNSIITIIASVGEDAAFSIDTISNTEVISYNTDTINPMSSVRLNAGVNWVTGGTNTAAVSANLATANIASAIATSLAFTNLTVGTINSISTTNFGSGYSQVPTVKVVDTEVRNVNIISDISIGGIKGNNAVITAVNSPGALSAVIVNNGGTNYSKFEVITIENKISSGTTNATGAAIVSATVNHTGRYLDTRSWLSWDSKLQDGLFYQEFSYVIRSTNLIKSYRRAVNDILHPSGTKLFGEVTIINTIESSSAIDKEYIIVNRTPLSINAAAIVGASYVSNVAIFAPDIEDELETEELNVTANRYIRTWRSANGTIYINANSHMANLQLSLAAYSLIPLSNMGTSRLVEGNTTVFDSNLINNANLMIVDTSNTQSNGLYQSSVVSSNTVIALNTDYEGNILTHGTYWYNN